MITIKTLQEQQAMHEAGLIVYEALQAVERAVQPGISTLELDRIAEAIIVKHGAKPSFKGYNGFPNTLCTSVDDEVVHGIPSDKVILKEGQIVGIDCGAILAGYHGDAALTVPVGKVSKEAELLIKVTRESFWMGADLARVGKRVSDIGHAVQTYCASYGFDVVRSLCGHGIGQAMHEEPEVPNYGVPGRGVRLVAGMTIAIEPMVVTGKYPVFTHRDGWTVKTQDGGLCAHYEHSLCIREEGLRPLILTLPQPPEGWA